MKPISKSYLFFIKLIAVIGLIVYLVFKIINEPILNSLKSIKIIDYYALAGCIILLFINWGLEAKKWQLMINPIQHMPYTLAFQSVLSGLATGLLTPNRLGNFIGRLAYLKKEHHNQAIIQTQIGNLAQFISTILMGIIGLLIAISYQFNVIHSFWIIIFSITILIFGLYIYFKPTIIFKFPIQRLISEKTKTSLTEVNDFTSLFKLKILALSILRYLIFSCQYYALFFMFNPTHSVKLLSLIMVVFLLTTIIPSFFFGKLFVRESVAVFVFTWFPLNTTLIILVAFLLWMINLAFPAIVGALFLIKQKQDV